MNARHRTGQVFPVELIASRIPAPQGDLICVLLHDLSQMTTVTQELRDTQRQLRAILDNTTQLHVLLDLDLVVQAFNRAGADATRRLGGPELVAGKRLGDYVGDLQHGDLRVGSQPRTWKVEQF
ncbi:MAG: hypothetical protein IPK16_00710 [Anaerolineales bacterium]|nr:hypothetical protein [Anaerolineales bacterium]